MTAAGAGGSIAGSSGGKKTANKQLKMQQQALNYGEGLINKAVGEAQPAMDYWSSLLSGNPTAAAGATGPYADIIRQQQGANAQQIAATTPAGGELQQAELNNSLQGSNQIARLYAGLQPQAAQMLTQTAALPLQAGQSLTGAGAPNIGAGLKYGTHTSEMAGNSLSQLGGALGQLFGQNNGNWINSGNPNVINTGGFIGPPAPAPSFGYPGYGTPDWGSLGGVLGGNVNMGTASMLGNQFAGPTWGLGNFNIFGNGSLLGNAGS